MVVTMEHMGHVANMVMVGMVYFGTLCGVYAESYIWSWYYSGSRLSLLFGWDGGAWPAKGGRAARGNVVEKKVTMKSLQTTCGCIHV